MTLPDVPTTPVAAAPTRKLSRPVLIGIIAGALVLLLGLGAVLVNIFLGGGQSASASAVAFPKSTLYWAEFAIDPSISQKTEAFRFVNEIDAVREAIEDSDLDVDLDDPETYSDFKESVWEFIVDGDDRGIDTDLDYEDDIAPWLGSRISIGMLPGGDLEEPALIIAIEARDTAAGADAIDELVDDLDLDVDTEVDVRDGYVIVATGDVDLDEVYDDGTLDKADGFAKASASAGDWGWASVYVDLGAVYAMVNEVTTGDYGDVDYWKSEIENNYYAYVDDSAYEYFEECPEEDTTQEPTEDSTDNGDGDYDYYSDCTYLYLYDGEYYEYYDDFAEAWVDDNVDELAEQKVEEYEEYADQQQALVDSLEGTTAFVVARFVDASLEVTGVVDGVHDLVMAPGSGDSEGQLPASTVALVSLAGLAETLDSSLSDENLAASSGGLGALAYGGTSTPITRDDVEEWFDDTLGVDFPDDLTTLFGSKIQLVADSDLDFSDLEDSQDPSNFGDVAGSGLALIITTDDTDATVSAWEDLLEKAEDSVGDDLGVDVETEGNRVILTGDDYLDTLISPDERLGDVDAFRRAVPQLDGASAVVYLDVAQLVDLFEDSAGSGGSFDFLDGVQALGVTTTRLSDDSYSFAFRLTTEAD